jgi:eukaryotic-like serine/threonine-protein kinase
MQSQSSVVIKVRLHPEPDEQAVGRPLDARSDIFSFGVVLYVLVAGHRPFAGATDVCD